MIEWLYKEENDVLSVLIKFEVEPKPLGLEHAIRVWILFSGLEEMRMNGITAFNIETILSPRYAKRLLEEHSNLRNKRKWI